MKKLIFTLLAFVAANISLAQAPEAFKYQTVVRDGSQNIIANQPVGVQIRILQGGSSGTPVYTETHSGITNAYGLMNLEIGNGTVASGNFSTIAWSTNAPFFLEVSVDITGGTSYVLMGASELLSVPYALSAGTVANVDDADADPTNEYNTNAALNGTDLEITDGGGTLTVDMSSMSGGGNPTDELNTTFTLVGTTLNITDAGGTLSADLSSLGGGNPTDELNTTMTLVGTTLNLTDAGGTLTSDLSSLVDDADADPTNELNTTFTLVGTTLNLTDPGGTLSADLSSLSGGGGNWTLSGNDIYNSNPGNVGIGTTTPNSDLHVEGTASDTDPNGVTIDITNTAGTGNSAGLNVTQTTSNALNAFGVESEAAVSGTTWGIGVYGRASGSTDNNRGVLGSTDGTGTTNNGVIGLSTGVSGGNNYGMYGYASGSTAQNAGVSGITDGTATFNIGTEGYAQGTGGDYNIGLWAETNTGGTLGNFAGYFVGDVEIIGNIAKSGGTFKIDHPQDPANKYLIHSFVESPDMMNIYNGNITTDADGYATVTMPDYFEAANKDFRYQLTVMGTFAQAIVKEQISGNTFVIQTSEPNVEVSWQVTGVRADKWAEENRVIPVVDKEQPGTYLHPELFGAGEENSIPNSIRPAENNQIQKVQK